MGLGLDPVYKLFHNTPGLGSSGALGTVSNFYLEFKERKSIWEGRFSYLLSPSANVSIHFLSNLC